MHNYFTKFWLNSITSFQYVISSHYLSNRNRFFLVSKRPKAFLFSKCTSSFLVCRNKRSNYRHRSRVMKGNGHLSMMSPCGYYPEGICLHRCLKQIPLIIQTSKMSQSHAVRAAPHYWISESSGSEWGWWALSLSKQGCRILGLTRHALATLLPFSSLPVALTMEAATNRVTNIF